MHLWGVKGQVLQPLFLSEFNRRKLGVIQVFISLQHAWSLVNWLNYSGPDNVSLAGPSVTGNGPQLQPTISYKVKIMQVQWLNKMPRWNTEKSEVLILLPVGLVCNWGLCLLLFWVCWRQILNTAILTWVQWRHSWQRPPAWHHQCCHCDSSLLRVK